MKWNVSLPIALLLVLMNVGQTAGFTEGAGFTENTGFTEGAGFSESEKAGNIVTSTRIDVPETHKIGGFAVGVQAYTFHRFSLMEAIEKTARAGGRVIEMYPGQQLSPDDDTTFDQFVSDDVMEQVKARLNEHDIKLVNFGVVGLPNDEDRVRPVFDFAQKMGIQIITSEPPEESMDLLEQMVQEYDIMLAIHNHPPNPENEDYRHWDPEYVRSMVDGRDPRMGASADIGHWIRSGIDPVNALQILEGRIISMHFTDVNEFGPQGVDVIAGTGAADLAGVLDELKRQNFGGNISVEYETNWYDNVTDVAQFIGFIRGWAHTRKSE